MAARKYLNHSFLLFAITITSMCYSCRTPQENSLTEQEVAEGWQLLFDGESLEGWRDYNGTAITGPWEVVDATII